MLFWRQLSHWLGGMGIIVLAVAILPRLRIGGRQLLQSELAGPTEIEQLGDTIRSTARRLWRLYVVLTLIAIAVLVFLSVTNLDDVMTLVRRGRPGALASSRSAGSARAPCRSPRSRRSRST